MDYIRMNEQQYDEFLASKPANVDEIIDAMETPSESSMWL